MFVVPTQDLHLGRVVVDGVEGHHAATVVRLQVGEPVTLTDGSGVRGEGVVAKAGKAQLLVDVGELTVVPNPSPRFVVVQALAKGDRGETAVETMTEVGVDVVVPWAASRSVVRWKPDRADKALAKWRSTAFAAAKQSRRSHFPEVTDPAPTADVSRLLVEAGVAVVLHEEGETALTEVVLPDVGDVVLVVGPEGGVSTDELAAFRGAGAAICRLGDTVLRTSTAGTAALAVLSAASRWR